MTLLNRLLLVLFSAGLIPIVPAGFFLYYYQAQAKKNIVAFEQNVSQMGALIVERETQDISRRLERMWDPGARYVTQEGLERALKNNPEFLYMAFTGADGRELFSRGEPELQRFFGYIDIANTPLFRSAAASGRPAMGQFEVIFDMPICRMVYPLGGGYYAFVAVNLRDLVEKLGSQRLGLSGGLLLTDSEGNSLVFSRALEKFSRQDLAHMAGLGPVFEFEGGKGVYIGAATQVRGFELYSMALEDRGEAFSGINRITWLMAFLLLAVATTFDFKTPVPESTDFSELNELLAAFNSMMREVDRYHGIQVEKLFEEKQKLELLISLIHDAILLFDLKGELLYANSTAKAMLGIGGPAGPGAEELRRKVSGLVYSKAASRDGVIEVEFPEGRKYCRVSLETLSSKVQSPAVFMVLRDITLEREIQKVKEEFFHSVAHDLRAPLLTMQGYIKLLEREFPPEAKQAGYVKSVKEASDRLFKMLENILDISRMEAGQLKPDKEKIKAGEFLSSAAESFRPLFEEKGVEFLVDVASAGDAEFSADSALLRRVIENLVSNAWKFTPAGGKVTASVAKYGPGLLFSVADNGPGIPPDQMDTIFEKYKRLDQAHGEAGFGLGLAIARKIVELHGGKIWAGAAPAGGSVFFVRLG